MTTNNPTTYWAPSTALAKLESRHNNAPCILTDTPAEFNDVALVRLADYQRLQADHERLQAECDLLRSAIRRLCNIYVIDDYYMGEQREDMLDRAVERSIDAALQEERNP